MFLRDIDVIESVSKNDLEEIKKLSEKAIVESVSASNQLKEEIISDTKSHIDHGLSSQ